MPRRGPTLKLTPQIQSSIETALRAGEPRRAAARQCGIGASTFYRWIHEGRDHPAGPFGSFLRSVEDAQAEYKSGVFETLQISGGGPENAFMRTTVRTTRRQLTCAEGRDLDGKDGPTMRSTGFVVETVTESKFDTRRALAWLGRRLAADDCDSAARLRHTAKSPQHLCHSAMQISKTRSKVSRVSQNDSAVKRLKSKTTAANN